MHLERSIEDVFAQINRVRHSPHDYALHHQDIESHYQGKLFRGRFKTREGPKAAKDLLYDLKNRHSNEHPLKWSFGLHMLADEKARLLGETGLSTTEGSSHHRSLPQRASDYVVLKGRVSEVVDFGADSPDEVIESILIDDGLGSRKRRATLLDPVYQYAGVGTALHSQFGVVVVIVLAEDVVSLGKVVMRKLLRGRRATS